jgi:tetratricopeptide (TPR) repeat protein
MGAAWAPGAVAVRRPWTPAFADVGGPGSRPGIHAAISDLDWRRRPRIPVPAAAGAAVVVLLALAAMWSTLQPLRSAHADDIAITRLELGQLDAAASVARIAHDRNPLSTDPLWELAFIEQLRGRLGSAEDALQQAVRLQPANAEAWRRLGRFQLSVLNRPAEALTSMRAAYYLDPQDPGSTSDYLEAARAVQAAGATP